ncbi:MAG: ArsR/SmtB family transcription factor [Bacillota bacterium]
MANYDKTLIDSSEIFKALGHPARLCIVNRLTNSSGLSVSQMQECLGVSQSSISQHLSILKNKGIISGERIGSEVIYSLVDTRMNSLVNVFIK